MARTSRTAAERNIPGSKGGRGVGQRGVKRPPSQRGAGKMRVANTRAARQAFQEQVLEDVPTFPVNVRIPLAVAYRNPRSNTYQVVDTRTNSGAISTRGGQKAVNLTAGPPSVNVPTSNINLSRFTPGQRQRAVQFFD
jgi:hypothetical protein